LAQAIETLSGDRAADQPVPPMIGARIAGE
jgi:hypothetical protein